MVIPSKDLEHPFSSRKPKSIFDSNVGSAGNVNPPTAKPVTIKKPFDNLFTGPSMTKKFDPNRRVAQKGCGIKKKVGEMDQSNLVS
jgi:hypothetical protein